MGFIVERIDITGSSNTVAVEVVVGAVVGGGDVFHMNL